MSLQIPHAATHSSLDIFQKPSILVNFDSANVPEIHPVGSYDGPNLEFQIQTDRHVFLDLQNLYLDITVKIVKGNAGTDLEGGDDVCFVNNTMHSLFSNCEVSFNNETIYSANGQYAHKAMLQAETSFTSGTKLSLLSCQGYSYEETPGDQTTAAFVARKATTALSAENVFVGKLMVDAFNCDKLLVPNTDIRITLTKSHPHFCMVSGDGNPPAKGYKVKFIKASLHSRQMTVTEPIHRSIQNALQKGPARYTYPDIQTKTFVIPAGQNQYIRENVFNNQPIRRIAFAMNRNADFTGTWTTNPFHYRKFGLREIRLTRAGHNLLTLNTEANVRPYRQTLQSLNFEQDGPGVSLTEYEDHFWVVIDTTSVLEANTEIYYPEIVGAGIRLELYFSAALTNTLELILLGEQLSTIYIHNDGRVSKDG